MRVLVTGASGFIGSHAAEHLRARGHDVVATGRSERHLRALADRGCRVVPADLAQSDLTTLVEGCDAIVHSAARASPWGNRSLFWNDNVVATQRLVESARGSGSVRRFVLISTPSIYFRTCDQLHITEAFTPPQRWATAYAETKWIAETHVRAAPELGPVILRPRAVFGPRDAAIVPRLVAVAKSGTFPLPGGGRAWADVTYIDNVVAAIMAALERGSEVEGRAFNITNGQSIQVRDLAERIFRALGIRTRFVSIPRSAALALAGISEAVAKLRPGQPEPRLTRYGVGLLAFSQTLSIEAARQGLRYEPGVSIDEGIVRYARWCAQ
ncbi:MAG TPA: NAD(P)-dependent oxidoreductase [Steroidobacteraceae bacterium]|nr:NAD(P)-dependent oxidoreductase [Steroidobacteraceae bacterium]